MLIRVLSALLGAITGAGLYFIFINRMLGYLRGEAFKAIFLASTFAILIGGLGVLGFALGQSVWMLGFGVVLLVMGMGEARYRLNRRRLEAGPPVSRSGRGVSILRPFTTTDLQVLRYEVASEIWRGRPFRIVQLSDFHINDRIPLAYYQQTVEQANQEQADFVLLTGDFVSEAKHIVCLPELLKRIDSRLGVYAILGNHDYWADGGQIEAILRESGARVLGDGWQRYCLEGQGEILFMGCEAPWSGRKWTPPEVEDGDMPIVLAHSADNVYRLAQIGAVAVFSGHYHAGQFQLPWLGPLVVPSSYGRRFSSGHFMVDGTHLFVSAGIGVGKPAFRLYCPPDLIVVDFMGKETENPGEEKLRRSAPGGR